MYTKDFKTFSVKLKVSGSVVYQNIEDLSREFQKILEGYLIKRFTVTVRGYRDARKCRFTAIFEQKQRDPAAIDALIDKVARRALLSVTTGNQNLK